MSIQESVQQSGYRAYREGVKKNRNPFQYTNNIMKQAAWITGWNKAMKELVK